MHSEVKLAIVGLGYVGLPLAVEFAKKLPVVGFDIDDKRVEELKREKIEPRSHIQTAYEASGLTLTSEENSLNTVIAI